MKVALVHDYLREYGGGERVLEVLHEMFPEAPIYTSYYYPDRMPKQFRSWNIISGAIQKWPLSRFLEKPFTYLVPLSFEQLDLRGFDLIISSSANFAKGVVTHPDQIHINYCHTPTRFLWGLNTQTKRNGLMKLLLGPLDSYLRQWDYAAAQRVDYFVANSHTVQKRIKRFYNRDSEVIFPPVLTDTLSEATLQRQKDAVLRKFNVPTNYFLSVARLFKVKNIDLLIQAFNSLQLPLVIVGTGNQMEYLRSIAGETIIFTGFVSEEELAVLYSGAQAFMAAATDEDFGMSVVEAQSYGVPVIAYKQGGYIESVAEGVSGMFFDSLQPDSVVAAVKAFHTKSFDKLIIVNHAQKFSKQSFVAHLERFIERVRAEK